MQNLSAEYSAVPNEMKKVAEYFGKEVLEQCKEDDVIENVKAIREFAGDRAVLRASTSLKKTNVWMQK
mgnify:CR=1 FL=1